MRLGQLLGVAIATPVKDGQRSNISAETIRTSLAAAGLLTADPGTPGWRRWCWCSCPSERRRRDGRPTTPLAATAIYTGLTTGLRVNAAGVVVLGDTASGEDGLLAELRADDLVTSTLATVDGGDTVHRPGDRDAGR